MIVHPTVLAYDIDARRLASTLPPGVAPRVTRLTRLSLPRFGHRQPATPRCAS